MKRGPALPKSKVGRKAHGQAAVEGAPCTRPYERIAHLIGCVCGGPKDLSERTGKKLRKFLLVRARE